MTDDLEKKPHPGPHDPEMTAAERLLEVLNHAHKNASPVTPWMLNTCQQIIDEQAAAP